MPAGLDLDLAFAFRYQRRVANDHTLSFAGHKLQLPASVNGRSYAKAKVELRHTMDGTLHVCYQDQLLTTFLPANRAHRAWISSSHRSRYSPFPGSGSGQALTTKRLAGSQPPGAQPPLAALSCIVATAAAAPPAPPAGPATLTFSLIAYPDIITDR